MPLLRLLSASLLVACTLPAKAQSVATQAAPNIQIPPLSKGAATLFDVPPPSAAAPVIVTAEVRGPVILSSSNGPCYTLRSYSITAQDMESAAPKPSSSSNCTRPSANMFKSTTAVLTR